MLKSAGGQLSAGISGRKSGRTSRKRASRTTDAAGPIAGVDEVGRGPLAGPVIAAAVILPPRKRITGLKDSKVLSAEKREDLDHEIRTKALAFAIGEASVEEIDSLNILHASMLAMQRAVEALTVAPGSALIDGNRCPELAIPSQAVIKGDQSVASISAASIIAKVYRDRLMLDLHTRHPDYGFDRHKGYPTRQHFEALNRHGVLAEHRRSFAPVRQRLEGQATVVESVSDHPTARTGKARSPR